MLVVIAVISLLITAAGPVFDGLTSSRSPAAAASIVSGQLERARSHAITKNTYVWVRLGKVAEEPYDFSIGVYESLDGTSLNTSAKGIWSAPRVPNFMLSNLKEDQRSLLHVPAANQVKEAAWVRFSPIGEARIQEAKAADSLNKLSPPDPDSDDLTVPRKWTLSPWTEFGLQSTTRQGQVPYSFKDKVAAVQLNGLTGQTLEFSR
jgi:type II secretory pathway pseudopilin PulG